MCIRNIWRASLQYIIHSLASLHTDWSRNARNRPSESVWTSSRGEAYWRSSLRTGASKSFFFFLIAHIEDDTVFSACCVNRQSPCMGRNTGLEPWLSGPPHSLRGSECWRTYNQFGWKTMLGHKISELHFVLSHIKLEFYKAVVMCLHLF